MLCFQVQDLTPLKTPLKLKDPFEIPLRFETPLIYKLNIPLEKQKGLNDKSRDFVWSERLKCNFKKIAINLKLRSVPEGVVIAERIGFWPGEAGMSAGAGGTGIVVELRVKKVNREIMLSFEGVL
jgi:hypothetical protein